MKMNTRKRFLPGLTLIFIVGLWAGVSFFIASPQTLIAEIGVDNGYLLIGLLAFISGLSMFGAAPYHLVLIALAAGGLNPWILALAAALGLAVGDSTSYFLGYHGRSFVPKRLEGFTLRIERFFARHKKMLPLYVFLYGALVPFSNDFIGVTMGLIRYPYWRIMIPLTLGTFIFNAALAFSTPFAYHAVQIFLQ